MRRRSLLFTAILIIMIGLGCVDEQPVETTETTATTADTVESPISTTVLTEGFSTPESVLYDPESDVYLVSNINGAPLDADDNGYISRISAADHSIEQKWIDGTTDEVELSAPKGMAFVANELWVSDIDTVRRFDRSTGAPLGSIKVEGAAFLNDVVAGDGVGYVSDSGMNSKFENIGTDQVYRISPSGEIETLAGDSSGLGAPNGLIVIDGNVWVVTYQSNELYRLAEDGKKTDVVTLPNGGLDGIVRTSDGNLLISSWGAKAVYRGEPGGPFTAFVENVNSPADIGYDTKRDLILIPVFMESRIEIHPYPGDTTETP